MINGVHALMYAKDAPRARAFFTNVLGLKGVDAGEGWLIFALPPAEVGIHPVMDEEGEYHELYLMCANVEQAMARLETKGVQCSPIYEAEWGRVTSFEVPGAGKMGMYQPKHPLAHGKKPAKRATKKAATKKAHKPAKKRQAGKKRGRKRR
jgi:catechol 2,3-dioxygenase-like lactoylglutathione lyase family enzyme